MPVCGFFQTDKRMIDKWFSILSCIIAFLCSLHGCASTDDNYGSADDAAVIRGNDCVSEKIIRSYEILDDQNLIIEVAGRGNYLVGLRTRARGLDEHRSIHFLSPAGICKGSQLIVYGSGGGREMIRLSSIRKITPEELDGLLIHYGKKAPDYNQSMKAEEGYGAEIEELD
jgi:hypothetical protein